MSSSIPEFSDVNELNYALNNLNYSLKNSDKLKKTDVEALVQTIAHASESLKTKESRVNTVELEKLTGRISDFKSILQNKKYANSAKIEKSLTAISNIRNTLVDKNKEPNPILNTAAQLSSLNAEIRTIADEREVILKLNKLNDEATSSENVNLEHFAELGQSINELNRTLHGKGFNSPRTVELLNNIYIKLATSSQQSSQAPPQTSSKSLEQLKADFLAARTEAPHIKSRADSLRAILNTFPSTNNKPELEHLKLEITFELYRADYSIEMTGNPDLESLQNMKEALEKHRSNEYPEDLTATLELLIALIENDIKYLARQVNTTQKVVTQAQTSVVAEPSPAALQAQRSLSPQVEPKPTVLTDRASVQPVNVRPSSPSSAPSRPLFNERFEKIKGLLTNTNYKLSNLDKIYLIDTFLKSVDADKELTSADKKELLVNLLKHFSQNSQSYSEESLTIISRLLEDKDLQHIKIDLFSFQTCVRTIDEKLEGFSHFQEIQELTNEKKQLLEQQSTTSKYTLTGLAISGKLEKVAKKLKQLLEDRTKNQEKTTEFSTANAKLKELLLKKIEDSFIKKTSALDSIALGIPEALNGKSQSIVSPESIYKVYEEFFNTEKEFLLRLKLTKSFLEKLNSNPDTNKEDLKKLDTIIGNSIEFSSEVFQTFEKSFINSESFDPTKIIDYFKNHGIELVNLVASGAQAIQLGVPISESIRMNELIRMKEEAVDPNVKMGIQVQINNRSEILKDFANEPLLAQGDIQSLIIGAVQRGPRYVLLLSEFKKQIGVYRAALERGSVADGPLKGMEKQMDNIIKSLNPEQKVLEKERYKRLEELVDQALNEVKAALEIANKAQK